MFFTVAAILLVALFVDQLIQFIAAHQIFMSQLTERPQVEES
jgi:hypothetical protein